MFTSTKIIIVCRITTFSDRIFYPLTAYDGQKRDSPHDEAAQPVAFGIDEPQGATPCPPERIDLIVVPGTAFTRAGARMGRGRGYYDRYLSRPGFHARTVGVCYTHQLLDTLPVEPHDVPLDRVIAG